VDDDPDHQQKYQHSKSIENNPPARGTFNCRVEHKAHQLSGQKKCGWMAAQKSPPINEQIIMVIRLYHYILYFSGRMTGMPDAPDSMTIERAAIKKVIRPAAS
jgi:hypothetical protein